MPRRARLRIANVPLHIIQRAGHHGTIFNDHQFALVVAELMQFLTTIEYNTRLREQSERAQ